MTIRIIDNQKLDMSDDEWTLYQKIVNSYTNQYQKGQDLFIDLFTSDDNGVIVLLKSPSTRHTSFEVFLFLMSLQQQQHLRIMYMMVDDVCAQMAEKMDEMEVKLKEKRKK